MTHSDDKTLNVFQIRIVNGKSAHNIAVCFDPCVNSVIHILRNQSEDGLEVGPFIKILAHLDEPLKVGSAVYGANGHVTVQHPMKVWLSL